MIHFQFLVSAQCRKQLTDILLDEMRKRVEQAVQKQDFMQILMDSVDENGAKLREMEVVENIVSLILGGYESTSDVMMWGLYYLAKHPEILERLKVYHYPMDYCCFKFASSILGD